MLIILYKNTIEEDYAGFITRKTKHVFLCKYSRTQHGEVTYQVSFI